MGNTFLHGQPTLLEFPFFPRFSKKSTLFSRVNLTFRVKSAHKLKLTDKQLLQWLFPILLVMMVYLSAWTLSDPPKVFCIHDIGHVFICAICQRLHIPNLFTLLFLARAPLIIRKQIRAWD